MIHLNGISSKETFIFIHLSGDLEWKSHFFVLTQNKIFYSEVQTDNDNDVDEIDEETQSTSLMSLGGGAGPAGAASNPSLSSTSMARTRSSIGITGEDCLLLA